MAELPSGILSGSITWQEGSSGPRHQGHHVVVVVSAMAGETDRLLRLAHQITKTPDERELDVLVSTGEQVSIALLAIALKNMGYDAKSYLGFQIKIATDSAFGKARITSIDSEKILNDLAKRTHCGGGRVPGSG